jgi:hypothetical protein
MVTLCGRITQIAMSTHGTSTEEEFEVIRFIEDHAPFPSLLGKIWIEKDQIQRKEEKEALEQKKQELMEFMTRRISYLMEEQENRSQAIKHQGPGCRSYKSIRGTTEDRNT